MGKSTLRKGLEKTLRETLNEKFEFLCVSSDEIRSDEVNELRKKNPKMSEDDLFTKSGRMSKSRFDIQVEFLLAKIKLAGNNIGFLFLDKCHMSNNMSATLDLINRLSHSNNIDTIPI